MTKPLLLIEDTPSLQMIYKSVLESGGHDVKTASSAGDGLTLFRKVQPDVVLLDLMLPDRDGLDLMKECLAITPDAKFIVITANGSINRAVDAMRAGAFEFLVKPFNEQRFLHAVETALSDTELPAVRQGASIEPVGSFIGSSTAMQQVYRKIRSVSRSMATVFITGESGTGKELCARAIHAESPRVAAPFVALNCAAIPFELMESEIFGHVKGAFTGAHADKVGKFLAADGGTLFLDEINSASPAMQLKLLRVLQERKFEPVGSNDTIEVDVRVILASNEPLEELVASGKFRQDLYYRINVVKIEMPPLRDRVSDIQSLAEHFLDLQASELGRQFTGFTPEAVDALRRYAYPGNVRELSNIVERAAVLTHSQTIGLEDLPQIVLDQRSQPMRIGSAPDTDQPWVAMTLNDAMTEPERRFVLRALEANEWNRQQTADVLGINRTTLYKKMKQLGIDPEDHSIAG